MEQPAIVERLARLEEKVSQLEASPVSTLRTEMNTGFAEVRAEFAEVRQEVRQQFDALEAKLDTGLEDTRRYMRVLYEDLVTRIATIGEGTPRRPPRKRR